MQFSEIEWGAVGVLYATNLLRFVSNRVASTPNGRCLCNLILYRFLSRGMHRDCPSALNLKVSSLPVGFAFV